MKKANGTVFKYGDNVDTDVIIPARYLNSSDPAELAQHCMEDIDKDFIKNVKPGDIIVADKNFGCGSSREHAINIGLPIIECPEAAEAIQAGDEVEIDFDTGIITDKTQNRQFKGQAFPPFMQKIIAAGGLINYINED